MNFNKNTFPFVLFFGFSIIYYFGSFSKVPFGDCMGFITDIEKGEFIISTSVYAHFLFSNSLIFIKKIFPFFDSIEIGRWFTIFFGVSSISILYKIIYTIIKNNWSSFFGSIIFGLSFTFWRNTEIVEIYTFNIFFIALFILYSVKYFQEKKDKFLLLSSFILGISLWNHIQNILLIPGFLFLLYHSKNWNLIVKSFSIFTILFLSLFTIPFFKEESFLIVFKAVSNHNINFKNFPKDILKSIFYLIFNFWHFTIFGIFGIFYSFKKHLELALFLLINAIPVYGFATLFSVSDNYVFFLPANFIFAIFISFSLYSVFPKKIFKLFSFSILFIPLFYIMSYHFSMEIEKGYEFNEQKKYKGGLKYYMLPWLNNNVGILETTIKNSETPEPLDWMKKSAKEYINLRIENGENLNDLENK